MNLDLKTIFFSNTLLLLTLCIYLFLIWKNHSNEYKGIFHFFFAMVLATLGHIGIGMQNVLPIFITVVFSNALLIVSTIFIYVSLSKFFNQEIQFSTKLFFAISVILFMFEQYYFRLVDDQIKVRIVSISFLTIIFLSLSIKTLFKHRKDISLPGVLLIFSFATLILGVLFRIPFTIFEDSPSYLLDRSGFDTVFMLINSLSTSSWPIGFALLISHRIQQREILRAKEKTVLLQELNHRTKNNMQVILSVLNLQKEKATIPETKKVIRDTSNRIYSIALVHDKLYASPDLYVIQLNDYLTDLVSVISESYSTSEKKITIEQQFDDISTSIDIAIPLGLVVNELLSNIYKHAFPQNTGKIRIFVHSRDEKNIEMIVQDNGVGFQEDLEAAKAKSLGLQILYSIVESQLGGSITFLQKNGLICTIRFQNVSHS